MYFAQRSHSLSLRLGSQNVLNIEAEEEEGEGGGGGLLPSKYICTKVAKGGGGGAGRGVVGVKCS